MPCKLPSDIVVCGWIFWKMHDQKSSISSCNLQRHFYNIGTSERGARRPFFKSASLPPLSLDCRTHCLARVTEEGPHSQLCKFVGIMHTVWPLPSKKKYRGGHSSRFPINQELAIAALNLNTPAAPFFYGSICLEGALNFKRRRCASSFVFLLPSASRSGSQWPILTRIEVRRRGIGS